FLLLFSLPENLDTSAQCSSRFLCRIRSQTNDLWRMLLRFQTLGQSVRLQIHTHIFHTHLWFPDTFEPRKTDRCFRINFLDCFHLCLIPIADCVKSLHSATLGNW